MINFRQGWRGHLWQERFASFVMDEQYLLAATRYIEINPVKSGLVKEPKEYEWSSARAHIERKDDNIVKVMPILGLVDDWKSFLSDAAQEQERKLIRTHDKPPNMVMLSLTTIIKHIFFPTLRIVQG